MLFLMFRIQQSDGRCQCALCRIRPLAISKATFRESWVKWCTVQRIQLYFFVSGSALARPRWTIGQDPAVLQLSKLPVLPLEQGLVGLAESRLKKDQPQVEAHMFFML